jgi:glycosyltransferase involved in cell wall biosynthesis
VARVAEVGRDRPMVVHVVTWLDTGGAQETAARLCSGLQSEGWEVVLLGGVAPGRESPSVESARVDGVTVEAVSWMGRSVRPWSDAVALLRLIGRLRELRPDVVHTHSSKAGLLGRLAAWMAGVPVRVHTVHGWSFDQDLEGAARKVAVRLERLAARITDALVVVTAVDRTRGLRAGVATRVKYHLIRSAIPASLYHPATETERALVKQAWGLDASTAVVGTVTRFAPPKDTLTLLAAFSVLLRSVPDAHLVIAGDGPERASVENDIGHRSLEGSVTLLGHAGDVAAVLRGFDLFAFSSRREGLPRVVVEAVAAGLPIVSTDVGGVAEVLRVAPSSRMVEAGDAPGMARAVREILGQPVGGTPAARAAALAGFDESDMVSAHDRLYRDLLALA